MKIKLSGAPNLIESAISGNLFTLSFFPSGKHAETKSGPPFLGADFLSCFSCVRSTECRPALTVMPTKIFLLKLHLFPLLELHESSFAVQPLAFFSL